MRLPNGEKIARENGDFQGIEKWQMIKNSVHTSKFDQRLWMPPAILDYGIEKPAITHLCSYASSHIKLSTCRLGEEQDDEGAQSDRDSKTD